MSFAQRNKKYLIGALGVVIVAIGLFCIYNFAIPQGARGENTIIASQEIIKDKLNSNDDEGIEVQANDDDEVEVQKGQIVDFYLTATYTGFGDDKSGLVTFNDQLPEYMKLVTGKSETDYDGSTKDCTPTITNTSGVTWSDPQNPYSYDEQNRTFSAKVDHIPAQQNQDTGNVVTIKISAKVTEDAESLGIDSLYYINYVSIMHAAATSVSDGVKLYSGFKNSKTYKVAYEFSGNVPSGITPPTDDNDYALDAKIEIKPGQEVQGWTFSGWELKSGQTTGVITYDKEKGTLVVKADTSGNVPTTVTFTGTFTKNKSIEVVHAWLGKETDSPTSADSEKDKPTTLVTPASSNQDEKMPIQIPKYPQIGEKTDDQLKNDDYKDLYSAYNFIGWQYEVTFTDNTGQSVTPSAAEVKAGEFFLSNLNLTKEVKYVKITGLWTRKTFSVTYKMEDGQTAPSGWNLPSAVKIKWGESFVPNVPAVDGYRFRGWRYEPTLGDPVNTTGNAIYTMPQQDVVAYGSFVKLYNVIINGGGTAACDGVQEGEKIQVAQGEVVTLKPVSFTGNDVEFNEWSYASQPSEWKLNSDKTATFVMGAQDVTFTASYYINVGFFVVNGTWSDDSTGYKFEKVAVSRQQDNTWQGTLGSAAVPTGMKPNPEFKNEGSWDNQPNISVNGVKADENGVATSTVLYTYSYTKNLDNITIKYVTENENKGKIKLNNSSDTSGNEKSETGSPLNGTFVGATAEPLAGYEFSKWTLQGSEDTFSLDQAIVPYKIANSGSNIEYYQASTYVARFVGYSYIVKFDSNGGTGSMEDKRFNVGEPQNLPANTFTKVKDGKQLKFAGWIAYKNNSDGSMEQIGRFEDRQEVQDLITTKDGIVTMKAQWSEEKSENSEYGLYGNNFDMSINEVEALLGQGSTEDSILAELVRRGNAFARNLTNHTNVDFVAVDHSQLVAERGNYEIILKINQATSYPTLTLTVTVYDKIDPSSQNKETIKANDFIISADIAKTYAAKLSGDESAKKEALTGLVKEAKAQAVDENDNNVEIASVSFSPALTNIKGDYNSTFATAKGTSTTVVCTVVDKVEPTPTPSDDNIKISANDFRITLDEAKQLTAATSAPVELQGDELDFVIKQAHASAEQISDGKKVAINKATSGIKHARGKYDITFESASLDGKTASVSVAATVIDNGSESEDSDERINANDFYIYVDEVSSLNPSSVISLANAKAEKVNDASPVTIPEDSEHVDFANVKAEKGRYPVTFKTDKGTTASVFCYVSDRGGSKPTDPDKPEDGKEIINANNFTLTVAEANTIHDATSASEVKDSEDKIKKLSNVVAINSNDEFIDMADISVDYDSLKNAETPINDGAYLVIFASPKGAQASVFAYVKSDPPVQEGDLNLSAFDFVVSKGEVEQYKLDDAEQSRQKLIEFARANAWTTNQEYFDAIITDINSSIQAKKGSYEVEFNAVLRDKQGTEADSTSVTIIATVTDKGGVDPTPTPVPDPSPDPSPDPTPDPDPEPIDKADAKVYGNDFYVSVEEVNKFNLTDGVVACDKLIELANAKARRISNGNEVAIEKVESNIVAKKGSYDVTFTTEAVNDKVAQLTVIAFVTDAGEVVENEERITANNFKLSKDEADAIKNGNVYESDSLIRVANAVQPLTEGQKELIRLANAKAVKVDDGAEVDIATVEFDYDGKLGDSNVTFATQKGTSINVTGTVTDASAENAENGERITADNIELTYEEATSLLSKSKAERDEYLIKEMKAEAISTYDGTSVEIVDVTNNIQASEGIYDVTFSTEKGTSVTAKAGVGVSPSKASKLTSTGDMFIYSILVLAIIVAGTSYVLYRRKKIGR